VRIAIVSDWFAPRRGGIEAQLLQLAERLGERGDEVDVITSTPEAVSGAHHRVRALRLLRLPKVDVAVSPRLVGALREALVTGYDVVHAHVSVVSPVGYIGAAVARSLDLPTLVTFHSILRYKRAALRAANAVVGLSRSRVRWTAVSELVATQVRHGLPDADVSVLPNGIDVRFWTVAADAPQPAHAGVRIVSATRLHAKKRPLQLIRAFARAASRVATPMHLVIAGELEVLGSHGMAAHAYPELLGLVASGRLDPTRLVTGTVGLDGTPAALAAMGSAPPAGVLLVKP